jgi:hypothetical protein
VKFPLASKHPMLTTPVLVEELVWWAKTTALVPELAVRVKLVPWTLKVSTEAFVTVPIPSQLEAVLMRVSVFPEMVKVPESICAAVDPSVRVPPKTPFQVFPLKTITLALFASS